MTEQQTFARPSPRGEGRRLKISVVVPMLNEERGLGPLIDRLRPVLDGLGHDWEVICVDDGSTDNTLAVLKRLNDQDPRVKSISLSRNFGKEIATAAGLSFTTGDAAIIMDADLQHPPELIADFVRRWREGYDVVFGQRIGTRVLYCLPETERHQPAGRRR
jgi:polyisoprenyl-phosphate glycosyltransferase